MQDPTGLYLAVSSPNKAITVDQNPDRLEEAQEILDRLQNYVEIFEVGTTRLVEKIGPKGANCMMQLSTMTWSQDCRYIGMGGYD